MLKLLKYVKRFWGREYSRGQKVLHPTPMKQRSINKLSNHPNDVKFRSGTSEIWGLKNRLHKYRFIDGMYCIKGIIVKLFERYCSIVETATLVPFKQGIKKRKQWVQRLA